MTDLELCRGGGRLTRYRAPGYFFCASCSFSIHAPADLSQIVPTHATVITANYVTDQLRRRFIDGRSDGNGSRYVLVEGVRNRAGFDATHEFDVVLIDTWPSMGLTINIIEVKISRSDWLRELKKPAKTQGAIDAGDTFSVAAPPGVVKPEDLRQGWGWYETRIDGVLQTRRAPTRHTRSWDASSNVINRSFAVALLRRKAETLNSRQKLEADNQPYTTEEITNASHARSTL